MALQRWQGMNFLITSYSLALEVKYETFYCYRLLE
jgi:hypothetical protein